MRKKKPKVVAAAIVKPENCVTYRYAGYGEVFFLTIPREFKDNLKRAIGEKYAKFEKGSAKIEEVIFTEIDGGKNPYIIILLVVPQRTPSDFHNFLAHLCIDNGFRLVDYLPE